MLKLRVITGPRAGRLITITDHEPVTIGRKTGRVRLHDSRISKNHAQITFVDGAWVVRDLGSSNGSYVNKNVLRGLAELEKNDLLQFGRVLVKVQQADGLGMEDDGGLPGVLASVSGIGTETATPTSARNRPSPSGPGLDDDDDELDLDALFAEEDGKGIDDDDDEPFELPKPAAKPTTKPTASTPPRVEPPAPRNRPETPLTPARPKPTEASAEAQASSAFDQVYSADDSQDDDQDDASQSTVIGADDDASDALDASDAGLDDSADLIQIEDDTPDAGRPVGSTIVLPETAEYTAVDESLEADTAKPQTAAKPSTSPSPAASTGWDALFDQHAGATDADADDASDYDDPSDASSAGAAAAADDSDAITIDGDEAPAEAATAPQPQAQAEREQTPAATDVNDDSLAAAVVEATADIESKPEPEPDIHAIADPMLEASTDALETMPLASMDAQDELDDAEEPPHDFDVEEDEVALTEQAEAVVGEGDADQDDTDDPSAELATDPTPKAGHEVDAATEDPEARSAEDDDPAAARPVDSDQAMQPAVAVQIDEAEDQSPAGDDFDIDAAFADLETGLDDDADDDASTDAAPDNNEPSLVDTNRDDKPSASPAGVIGTQIDVAYIQEALAKLPVVDEDKNPFGIKRSGKHEASADLAEADAREDAHDASPRKPIESSGSASAVAEELASDPSHSPDLLGGQFAEQAPPSAPRDQAVGYPVQPPPGINPITLMEPQEPRSSRVVASRGQSVRRFLPAAIILLFVGGLSGFFIANPDAITGRDKPTQPTASPQEPAPNKPAPADPDTNPDSSATNPNPQPTEQPERPIFEIKPNTQAQDRLPVVGIAQPGTAPEPDPFAQGPLVIGEQAVAGLGTRPTTPIGPIPDQSDQPVTNANNPPVDTNLPPVTNPKPDTTVGQNDDATDPETNPAPAVALDGDRLVFLVDASGSLVDSLPQMVSWLGEALDNLEPNEQFTIIFFQQDRAIEVPPAGIQPMTRTYRRALDRDWLSPDKVPILPAGRSNPAEALKLALTYNPSDIYLLSDASFGKSTGDTTRNEAVQTVVQVLGDAEVRVHGVQFFYQDQEQAGTLQLLAAEFDGTYEFVAEARLPDQDPIDLLEELENRNR